jgi:hypothetical protein
MVPPGSAAPSAQTRPQSPRPESEPPPRLRSIIAEGPKPVIVNHEAHGQPSRAPQFNHWRPHRSLGQRGPCDSSALRPRSPEACGRIVAEPILGALHYIYKSRQHEGRYFCAPEATLQINARCFASVATQSPFLKVHRGGIDDRRVIFRGALLAPIDR